MQKTNKLNRLVYAEDVLKNIDRDRAYMTDVGRIHARAAVNDAPTVEEKHGRWIPVTERLPEQSGKYIVCSERKIKVGNWERMEKKVYQAKFYVYPTGCHWGQRDKGKHITHWMPMPEVPKGE